MLRRNRTQQAVGSHEPRAFDDLHEWVLSLPWVVERPYSVGTPGVRSFGIDCEPLGRRQLWLITGLQRALESEGVGVAVIVPAEVAGEIETTGWARSLAPMPGRHAMVAVYGDAVGRRADLEALVLTAYGYALS
jgi:hypothetical protein